MPCRVDPTQTCPLTTGGSRRTHPAGTPALFWSRRTPDSRAVGVASEDARREHVSRWTACGAVRACGSIVNVQSGVAQGQALLLVAWLPAGGSGVENRLSMQERTSLAELSGKLEVWLDHPARLAADDWSL